MGRALFLSGFSLMPQSFGIAAMLSVAPPSLLWAGTTFTNLADHVAATADTDGSSAFRGKSECGYGQKHMKKQAAC